MCAAVSAAAVVAQPPGTPPPGDVFEPSADDGPEALPIRAFLFLSESGNPVVMPGLTWEELQRLMDLDAGNDASVGAYSYQSLEIRGSVQQGRAAVEVELQVTVEPTGGNWVSIPLRMGNFRRVSPPDVSGADQHTTQLLPDGQGYQLLVKCDRRQDVAFRMRATARVESGRQQQSLEFRLPDVPTKIQLTTETAQPRGEVIGRGDEFVATQAREDQRTDLIVESSGGNFLLRWGEPTSEAQEQLLEAESSVLLRWPSPQDPLIAAVRIKLESLSGSIDQFQMRFPPQATLLKPPRLGTSGQRIDFDATAPQGDGGTVYRVLIPEQERRERLDLNFELQLPGQEATARDPLTLQIPEVLGALRQYGEIEIRAGGDYRLRWRSKPWIRIAPQVEGEANGSIRGHRFRFDRGSFELPIWLGREESQVRISSEAMITIREGAAHLEMTIRVGGQFEGNLQLDEAGWQLNAIADLESGEPLDSYSSNLMRVIELESAGGARAETIRLRGTFPLAASDPQMEIPLPRIVDLGEVALVQDVTVDLVSSGRSVFVVDLQATKHLRRLSTEPEKYKDLSASRFQVTHVDSPLVLVGTLIQQPPQIDLVCRARVELDGKQLRGEVDWTVSSPVDLEGRLPVRIPLSATRDAADSSDLPPPSRGDSNGSAAASSAAVGSGASRFFLGIPWERLTPGRAAEKLPWVVTVDDSPAILRRVDQDRYELISDRLGSGQSVLRWRRSTPLDEVPQDGRISGLPLPRPDFSDVTLLGPVSLTLRSNPEFELTTADSQETGELQWEALPREPVRIQIRPRTSTEQSLSIQHALLRTAVGHRTRQEQVLVNVQGGGPFRVTIPELGSSLVVEGFIDGQSAIVGRDANQLVMTVPSDSSPHTVDLRIWYAQPSSPPWTSVAPTMILPMDSGRVLWQIVAPRDGHIIWATPSLGRSMFWSFDRWRLYRTPTQSDAQLTAMFPSAPLEFPVGNSYLYIGTDLPSYQVIVVSRTTLWLVVGSLVLLVAALLSFLPALRHPLAMVFAAVLFAGLLVVAPDAAVLIGGLGMIAATLIVIVIVIARMLRGGRRDRVFTTGSGYDYADPRSTAGGDRPSSRAAPDLVSSPSTVPPPPTEVSP